jgi:hypothetical protein
VEVLGFKVAVFYGVEFGIKINGGSGSFAFGSIPGTVSDIQTMKPKVLIPVSGKKK